MQFDALLLSKILSILSIIQHHLQPSIALLIFLGAAVSVTMGGHPVAVEFLWTSKKEVPLHWFKALL